MNRSLPALHIAVFLFGLAGLFGKFLHQPALVIVFGRTAFAVVTLAGIMRLRGEVFRPHTSRDQVQLALTGVLLAVHWLTFFQAIIVSTVAVGLLSFASFPLFTTILEPIVFREKPRALDFVWAALVTLGLVLVTPNFDLGDRIVQGAAWGVLSGLTFAVLSLMNRRFASGYPPRLVAFHQNLFAALSTAPFLLLLDKGVTVQEVLWLALLGVFCTATAHALFISALKHIKAGAASVVTALEPVYGIVLAALLLNETPELRTLLGGALILSAAVLAARFRH